MAELRKAACDAIDDAVDKLHEISNKIWSNPEEKFEEIKAHDNITTFLEANAFKVERNYILNTGFRSVVGADGPHIIVLCEYDALPEIGHACGHNLIAEVGLAAGIGIRAAINASKAPLGKLTILDTPAEEGGGGKLYMIDAGCFNDVDVAMMAHPTPFNMEHFECLAIESVIIKYHGKAAHASAFPWDGVNALDAAVLCYQSVSCLRQQFKPTWRVHGNNTSVEIIANTYAENISGIIMKGGTKPNIIPDLTELEFYARAPTKAELVVLKKKLDTCFQSAADSTGCEVEIKWSGKPHYDMQSIRTLSIVYKTYAISLGVDFDTHGISKYNGNVPTGSTDMGNVSYVVPSIHPMFYIGSEAVNHTKEFTAVAGADAAQSYTIMVAKSIAMTAIDVMTQPDLLKEIKEEFQTKMADK